MVPETPAPASTLIPVNCTIIVRLSKILCERLFEHLTQTVTQTGIGAGSRQRKQRSGQQIILSQKGRKGRDIPFFPPPAHLHTQEVNGSSPLVSTIPEQVLCRLLRLFFCKIRRTLPQLCRSALQPGKSTEPQKRLPPCQAPAGGLSQRELSCKESVVDADHHGSRFDDSVSRLANFQTQFLDGGH